MSLSLVEDNHETKDLQEDYTPSEFDAIVGWARQHYHHRKLSSRQDALKFPSSRSLFRSISRFSVAFVAVPVHHNL
jgi:hypothetical protein